VSGVKNNRIACLAHDYEASVVNHKVSVPEACTPFTQEDTRIASACDLLCYELHICRVEKLTLLYVYRFTGCSRRYKQVRLSAKKRRYLKYIDDLSYNASLFLCVHVGQDWRAD
jgi:hypothetical protein